MQPSDLKISQPCKIRRSHTGCRPCRRRGKRCDENKPACKACTRLSLECSYGINYQFRNISKEMLQGSTVSHNVSSRAVVSPAHNISRNVLARKHHVDIISPLGRVTDLQLPATLNSSHDLESAYFNHFQSHVRYLLPAHSPQLTETAFQSPALRFAMLCLSASNLSMLNAQVQSRILPGDSRGSVFSPSVNKLHHSNARQYHDLALWCCRTADTSGTERESAMLLTAHVLLSYYHHASTDHLSFRVAVGDSIRFVLQNRTSLVRSVEGARALQLWYRLCTSHRPAKSPALLLEGEGADPQGSSALPDVTEHLYLNCILGMSADDLIYDILIKTLEIRTKLVMFRCVAETFQISELSSELGSLTHEVLNRMLGRSCTRHEYAQAREGFVGGHHLLGLLEVQKERLKVWQSRLNADQLPISFPPLHHKFPTHRDAMNAMYYMLCQLAIETSYQSPLSSVSLDKGSDFPTTSIDSIAQGICHIAGSLNFRTSITSDVYTLSLAEVLLQLVFLWRSDALLHEILDVLWPQIEDNGRGYEHSHYPTHLVKRILNQVALYWENNRVVLLALPAVAEDLSKSKLLDISYQIDVVVCGCNEAGNHFIEKARLP